MTRRPLAPQTVRRGALAGGALALALALGGCRADQVAAVGPVVSTVGHPEGAAEQDLRGALRLSIDEQGVGRDSLMVFTLDECETWNVPVRADGDRVVPNVDERTVLTMDCPPPPAERRWVEGVLEHPFEIHQQGEHVVLVGEAGRIELASAE